MIDCIFNSNLSHCVQHSQSPDLSRLHVRSAPLRSEEIADVEKEEVSVFELHAPSVHPDEAGKIAQGRDHVEGPDVFDAPGRTEGEPGALG